MLSRLPARDITGAFVPAMALLLAVSVHPLSAASAADDSTGSATSIPTTEIQDRDGATAAVTRYDQPPVPAVLGATGTVNKLNKGKVDPVPLVEDGVVGGGQGQPTVILPPAAQGQDAPDDLIFARQPVVVTDTASSTAEPQVAVKGDRVLTVWNWGAAQSFDGGATYRYLDPFTALPSASDGFCCDQLAAYLPDHDLWIWVLQYLPTPGPEGTNVLRLAVAQGDAAFDASEFTYFDFTAQEAGLEAGIWLDQPKVGWTDEAVFLSVNAYHPLPPDGDGFYEASVVWRLAIDRLVSGALSGNVMTTVGQADPNGQPLFAPYPIRDSGSTMYLAAHNDQATLAVWEWADDGPGPVFRLITSRTETGEPLNYPLGPAYSCPTEGAQDPVTSDWCAFSSDRINTGWRRGDIIGYAWNVPQGGGWSSEFPWLWGVELDPAQFDSCDDGSCVVGYPSIWLQDRAVQYAAVAHNADGDLGGVVLAGGGRHPLGCYAISRPHDAPPEAGWNILTVALSEAESPEARSGDYLGASPPTADGDGFAGTCMTLHGGEAQATKTRVHVARFGARSDVAP